MWAVLSPVWAWPFRRGELRASVIRRSAGIEALAGQVGSRLRAALLALIVTALGACSTLPPGSWYSKSVSKALTDPQTTTLGRAFVEEQRAHDPDSAFRIIPTGADGFLLRMQMVKAAERTIDLQYFVFQGDNTGRLLTGAVLHAADRGVRVRILIDDGETEDGDEQITLLEAHPLIEIRFFNPFAYRGHAKLLRAVEFAFNAARLDYRMHNKLLVVDNAIALIGGRNIGDAYFQIDPEGQFADDDVFTVGPIVARLSATFDEFWSSPLSIPVVALSGAAPTPTALGEHRKELKDDDRQLKTEGLDYVTRVASGEPFESLVSGRLPLVWAHVVLVCDSPDKKSVENGDMVGRLMRRKVAEVMSAVREELLMVTPYLIPGSEGMQLITDLRRRNVRIRVITNSLESSTVLLAQSGYMRYRQPLLASGVELYEIRSMLGNTRGSGQTVTISRFGNYSLHAKLFVFDRKKVFIGSMNFDQRSLHLNTEIGLIIDSPVLAQQVAARFEAMVKPVNAYELFVRVPLAGAAPSLGWRTEEDGKTVEYEREPARSAWQRFKAETLSLMPLDREL
jgi:putative cardiolipin synthase